MLLREVRGIMLNEMRYVYAVYQEKSFTQAAKKMFISQPALSKMVKLAETEVGVPLFRPQHSSSDLDSRRKGVYRLCSENSPFGAGYPDLFFGYPLAEKRQHSSRRLILFLFICAAQAIWDFFCTISQYCAFHDRGQCIYSACRIGG